MKAIGINLFNGCSRGLAMIAVVWICLPANPVSGQSTNADTWHWMPLGTQSAPAPRDNVSAVWTGTQMLIWGGQLSSGSSSYQTNGYCYHPGTDSWSPMSVENAPTPRYQPTAIWTGHEMIIWGGAKAKDSSGSWNTGSRYDPVSDTWHPMTTEGAPSPRQGQTAVWTGSKLIVWAGEGSQGSPLKSGGCYDPVTDTWKLVSTKDAPPGCWQSAAVWTGQEMIVWGGNYLSVDDSYNFYFTYVKFVGRYDPESDSWVTKTVSGPPPPRADCSAIWDGTEMIVWGGYNGNSFSYGSHAVLNSGGRFNPVSETWTLMSMTQVPATRENHIALWTGKEMIVWGGNSHGKSLKDGGRYNPDSNTWIMGSTNGAPTNSYAGEGVWTGEAMLVYDKTLSAYYEPGLYAWDGLPDDWQRHYFGENNPMAAPLADPDGDGQNNRQEYVAGTDPTNASSRLQFTIESLPGQTGQFTLAFSPWKDGRVYTLLGGTDLNAGALAPLAATYNRQGETNACFTITNVNSAAQFFRLQIELP